MRVYSSAIILSRKHAMPIAPSPFRQHCSACDWRGDVISPRSDALSPADFSSILEICPRCGAADLQFESERVVGSALQSVLGSLLGRRS